MLLDNVIECEYYSVSSIVKVDFMVYVSQSAIKKYMTKTVSILSTKLFCDFVQLTYLLNSNLL